MAEQLTSSWGCARERRVWAGLRVVGKSRNAGIGTTTTARMPAGTAQIRSSDSGIGAQKDRYQYDGSGAPDGSEAYSHARFSILAISIIAQRSSSA